MVGLLFVGWLVVWNLERVRLGSFWFIWPPVFPVRFLEISLRWERTLIVKSN
jgi:hypothetical protein